MQFGLKSTDLKDTCDVLKKFCQIEQAVLFGSRAKGNYQHGSDVDIALKGKELTSQIVREVSFILNEESLMPYKFDVLNYHTIQETALKEHIDKVGVIIYERKKWSIE